MLAPAEGEPRGWYEEFVGRWRAYLEVMACPRGTRPLSAVEPAAAARIRPPPIAATSSSPTALAAPIHPAAPQPQRKRQRPANPSGASSPATPPDPPSAICGSVVALQPEGAEQLEDRGRQDEHVTGPGGAAKRRRTAPPRPPKRPHSPPATSSPLPTAPRVQMTLSSWLHPRRTMEATPSQTEDPPPKRLRHGRAAAGPPT